MIVIGKGSWGKRLADRYGASITGVREPVKLTSYGTVVVAVPSIYLEELKNFEGCKDSLVLSAVKGLFKDGRLPSEYIKSIWEVQDVITVGGPNFPEDEIIEFGGKDLEKSGILKNVYAIGYAMETNINKRAYDILNYIEEMKKATERLYLEDLLATCVNPDSRNHIYGRTGKIPEGQVVEGRETARIIEKYDLYPELEHLRRITRKIVHVLEPEYRKPKLRS